MVDIEKAIAKGKSMIGKIKYSMNYSRTGADGTADCSGFVYACLRAGGGSNFGYVPSTETLHEYLTKNGFKLIAENKTWQMKRGDVVIWGKRGYSAGSAGHTGICLDGRNWIECTAWKQLGVTTQDHDARWAMNGGPYFYVYRQDTSSVEPPKPVTPSKPTPTAPSGNGKMVPQKAKFTASETVNIRRMATTKGNNPVATLKAGDTIQYDHYIDADGWRWVSYIGFSGNRNYVAVRRLSDNYRTGKCY